MELDDFDLTKFADKGATLELYHPVEFKPFDEVINESTGKPLDAIFIDVLGHDSKEYLDVMREEAKAAQTAGAIDPVESQQRVFARMIKGWSGITRKGEAFDYSVENAQIMLVKYNWIAVQVKAFCEDRANFFLSEKPKAKA